MTVEEFDDVIMGAGAAGCVLANRRSDTGRNTVAVIEASGQDNHIWIKIPAGFNKTVYNDKLNWGYGTAPLMAANEAAGMKRCRSAEHEGDRPQRPQGRRCLVHAAHGVG